MDRFRVRRSSYGPFVQVIAACSGHRCTSAASPGPRRLRSDQPVTSGCGWFPARSFPQTILPAKSKAPGIRPGLCFLPRAPHLPRRCLSSSSPSLIFQAASRPRRATYGTRSPLRLWPVGAIVFVRRMPIPFHRAPAFRYAKSVIARQTRIGRRQTYRKGKSPGLRWRTIGLEE